MSGASRTKWARTLLGVAAVGLLPSSAEAATWVRTRTRPYLREIVSIDATGERSWPYGAEDVAGDGLATFTTAEQGLDLRTAYAATDDQRLWVRVYVSEPTAVSLDATVFVFVDADQNTSTGGRASSLDISPSFTTDPTTGGYEYVIGIRGNGTLDSLWEWRQPQGRFATVTIDPATASAEAGTDLDPIRIYGRERGYVQASVELGKVGLTTACKANLYVRSINNQAPTLGPGDLDGGQLAACIPFDRNNDGVPDVIVYTSECTEDAQCPGRGVCVDRRCVYSSLCLADADCASGYRCSAEGECIVRDGGTCTTNDDCSNGLVCTAGQCTACSPGDACGAGKRCDRDGRCVAEGDVGSGSGGGATAGSSGGDAGGYTPVPGENIEGGAFNCALGTGRSANGTLAAVALLALGLVLPRKKARRAGRSPKGANKDA